MPNPTRSLERAEDIKLARLCRALQGAKTAGHQRSLVGSILSASRTAVRASLRGTYKAVTSTTGRLVVSNVSRAVIGGVVGSVAGDTAGMFAGDLSVRILGSAIRKSAAPGDVSFGKEVVRDVVGTVAGMATNYAGSGIFGPRFSGLIAGTLVGDKIEAMLFGRGPTPPALASARLEDAATRHGNDDELLTADVETLNQRRRVVERGVGLGAASAAIGASAVTAAMLASGMVSPAKAAAMGWKFAKDSPVTRAAARGIVTAAVGSRIGSGVSSVARVASRAVNGALHKVGLRDKALPAPVIRALWFSKLRQAAEQVTLGGVVTRAAEVGSAVATAWASDAVVQGAVAGADKLSEWSSIDEAHASIRSGYDAARAWVEDRVGTMDPRSLVEGAMRAVRTTLAPAEAEARARARQETERLQREAFESAMEGRATECTLADMEQAFRRGVEDMERAFERAGERREAEALKTAYDDFVENTAAGRFANSVLGQGRSPGYLYEMLPGFGMTRGLRRMYWGMRGAAIGVKAGAYATAGDGNAAERAFDAADATLGGLTGTLSEQYAHVNAYIGGDKVYNAFTALGYNPVRTQGEGISDLLVGELATDTAGSWFW